MMVGKIRGLTVEREVDNNVKSATIQVQQHTNTAIILSISTYKEM